MVVFARPSGWSFHLFVCLSNFHLVEHLAHFAKLPWAFPYLLMHGPVAGENAGHMWSQRACSITSTSFAWAVGIAGVGSQIGGGT